MIIIDRYDPRNDKEALKEIFKDFINNKAYFNCEWQKFENEVNNRVLDLKSRNSMVVAKEDGKLLGWATYSIFGDYLGNQRVLIHQVLTRKEDSFKKGIEEKILRELQEYIKKTERINRAYIISPDSDNAKRSLLMKLGFKKSKFFWYEKDL